MLKSAKVPYAVQVANGMNVVVRVARNRYVANITDINHENAEVDVTLLWPRMPAQRFRWPDELKCATLPLPDVICEVELTEVNGFYVLSDSSKAKLLKLGVIRK
jgi:hypothetical protein